MFKRFITNNKEPLFTAELKVNQGTPITGIEQIYKDRAKIMGLSQEHLQALKEINPIIFEMIDEAVEIILDELLEIPELKEIATTKTSRDKLHIVFKNYLITIFNGVFDDNFHQMRNRMGNIHLRGGLPIGWFLATYGTYQSILIPKIVETLQDNPEKLSTTILAVNHLFNLDGQMVVEDYMNSKIAQIEDSNNRNLILREELFTISQELATSMEQSEATVLETSSKTQMIKDNTVQTSKSSQNLVNLTLQYEQQIEDMTKSFEKLIEKIAFSINRTDALKELSGQITNMTKEIQNVAEQTNLLALNAAIEAARAGHEGRGFTVVANEVRKLAENSKNMSNQIVELITESRANIESLVEIMNEMNNFSTSSQQNINQVKTGLLTVKYEMSNFIDSFTKNAKDLDIIANSIQDLNETTHNLSRLSTALMDKAENLNK